MKSVVLGNLMLPTWCIAVVFWLLLGISNSKAQDQPVSYSLSIDAISVATGGAVNDDIRTVTSDGVTSGGNSYTAFTSTNKRDVNHGVTIEIATRNFSHSLPGKATVEWMFFAKPFVRTDGDEFITGRGLSVITIPPGITDKFRVVSPVLRSFTKQTVSGANPSGSTPGNVYYVPKVVSEAGGTKLTGWAVRLVVDGKVIRTKGSTKRYEEIAASDLKIDQMTQR